MLADKLRAALAPAKSGSDPAQAGKPGASGSGAAGDSGPGAGSTGTAGTDTKQES